MADNPSFAEVMDFFAERSATEAEQFEDERDTEIPNHGGAVVIDEASSLLRTLTNVDMNEEMADEDDDIDTEAMNDEIESEVVDVLAALGVLQFERDIDIGAAVEERIEFVEQYEAFEDAMADAETDEEHMAVMDEHLTDEMAEKLGIEQPPMVGESVDADGYDPEGLGRGVQ